ncbi:MAG: hypothetical protein JWM85_3602 [Acidimicrobiaceae bacterium]|nr:hypothetical protein [Acidimicrobiaceae bacterium]
MIGRREFRIVATCIRVERDTMTEPLNADAANVILDSLTISLGRQFRALNPRFDWERFKETAGYGERGA